MQITHTHANTRTHVAMDTCNPFCHCAGRKKTLKKKIEIDKREERKEREQIQEVERKQTRALQRQRRKRQHFVQKGWLCVLATLSETHFNKLCLGMTVE